MECVADEVLKKHGFKRRKGSLTYIRRLEELRQEIVMEAYFFPKYQPGAEIHISPSLRLFDDLLSDVALKLVHGNKRLLANSPETILNQPIEFAAPKDTNARWFASGYDKIKQCVLGIVLFIEKWVIPLLDDLKTREDLVRAYESNDKRLLKQRHWYIFIVAVKVVQGDLGGAFAVWKSSFDSPGLKKRYAVIFDSLAQLENQVGFIKS